MEAVCNDSSLSTVTVKITKPSKTTETAEIAESPRIQDVVLEDRLLKAKTVGISKDHVGYILHEILNMKSYRPTGYRVCSLRATGATVRPLHSSV